MAKRKRFAIKLDGATWQCTGAQLRLDDQVSAGEFNHARVRVLFVRQVGEERREIPVWLTFQRDLSRTGGVAVGSMDTRRCWGRAYGGAVELSHRVRSFDIADRPFRLDQEDRLAVEIARRIARAIHEYNLHRVSDDECVQVVEALEKLGAYVEKLYDVGHPDELVDLHAVEGRYANQRARQDIAERN